MLSPSAIVGCAKSASASLEKACQAPLIVTHGWPGSIIEQLKVIDPLANPTAYGASASDAFDLVIPFSWLRLSAKPTATG